MNLPDQLSRWVAGAILQGKWMIGIAVTILLPALFLLKKSGHPLQNGIAVPIGILFLLNAGYGGYLLFSRPGHRAEVQLAYRQNTGRTLHDELRKGREDSRSYTVTKSLWTGLLLVSVLCYFLLTTDFWKGCSIGFAILFLGTLLIDVSLHKRQNVYLTAISRSASEN